ncbi:MAG: PKD domain-containing protein [bacterium]|nr:PKD domain-containing protein [bacterium]
MYYGVIALYLLSAVFSSERIFVSKVGEQSRVSVAYHSGRFIAAYEDTNCGKPEKHICMNIGGAEELGDDSFASTSFPSVGVDSNGNIYLVWSDARAVDPNTGQRTWDIYLRKKSGNSWQPSQRIHPKTPSDQCNASGDQINPDIYVSSTGIYIVWQSIESNGRSFVCFVHSPDFGNTWNPNKKLGEGYVPSVAVYGSNIYIAFSDINGNVRFLSSSDGGNSFMLRANPIYNARRRIPDLSSPDIAVSPTGNILVALQDRVEKLGTEDIDIILIASRDGGVSWSSPSNLDLPGDQTNPSIIYTGGIFIFYNQTKNEAIGPDIYQVEAQGNISVSYGEFSPTGTIEVNSGIQNTVIFQMKLTASPEIGEAEIKTLRFKASGTFVDQNHISKVRIYHDVDGNGVITSSDSILSESVFQADDSFVLLSVNRVVSASPIYIIFVVDLAVPIPRGSTFFVSLNPSADILAVVPSTSVGVPVTGPVLSSATLRVRNNLPIVNVVANPQSVLERSGVSVVLDASSSYDPDGDSINFSWYQLSGIPVSLNIAGQTASFVAPSSVTRNENLVFGVTVSDSFGGSSTKQVSVVVIDSLNEPPVARARVNVGGSLFGGVVEVNEGSTVILDASQSYDPNGDPIFYFWTKISGQDISISSPAGITASFVAPDVVGSSFDTVVVNLSVRDSKGATSSDRIEIRIRNTKDDPPVAVFSSNPRRGTVPLNVFFDASASFDYDGFIVLYSWNFGDGSVLDTTSPTISHTYVNPGEYRAILKVRDSGGNESVFSSFITALSSVPAISVSAQSLETRIPYGSPRNVLSLRISNISGESIFLNSINFRIQGVPLALLEFFIDETQDGVADRRIQSFPVSTTAISVISLALNTTLSEGSNITIYVSATLNPSGVPANYEVSVLGISARGSISGTEPDIYGITFPYTVRFSVSKPALVFSYPSTFAVISGDKIPFFVDVSANGADFSISSISFEYDPTKILYLVVYEDINQNRVFDSSDVLISELKSGEQSLNLRLNIPRGTKKRIGFQAYPVPNQSSPQFYVYALAFVFSASLFFRRKFYILVVLILSLNLLTCANKPGKGTASRPPPEQQQPDLPRGDQGDIEIPDQGQIDFSKYRVITKFKINGVRLSSAPSDYDVVGLPLDIWIVY